MEVQTAQEVENQSNDEEMKEVSTAPPEETSISPTNNVQPTISAEVTVVDTDEGSNSNSLLIDEDAKVEMEIDEKDKEDGKVEMEIDEKYKEDAKVKVEIDEKDKEDAKVKVEMEINEKDKEDAKVKVEMEIDEKDKEENNLDNSTRTNDQPAEERDILVEVVTLEAAFHALKKTKIGKDPATDAEVVAAVRSRKEQSNNGSREQRLHPHEKRDSSFPKPSSSSNKGKETPSNSGRFSTNGSSPSSSIATELNYKRSRSTSEHNNSSKESSSVATTFIKPLSKKKESPKNAQPRRKSDESKEKRKSDESKGRRKSTEENKQAKQKRKSSRGLKPPKNNDDEESIDDVSSEISLVSVRESRPRRSKTVAVTKVPKDGSELLVKEEETPSCLVPVTNPNDITPTVLCGAGKTCKGTGISEFPCRRCHREFYCCQDHQKNDAEEHKERCKITAQLEDIKADPKYSMWLKYSLPYLYDKCLNFVLVWPSLTVQWLPEKIELEDEVQYKVILATQTSGEPNHLIILGVDLPKSEKLRFDGVGRVLKRINHDQEVHRARYMPQNTDIIATKSPSRDVYVFNTLEYKDVPEDNVFNPTLRLQGHTMEGFGLAWNPHTPGMLISGSNDGVVCFWDTNATPTLNKETGLMCIDAATKLIQHTAVVEDVDWHHESEHVVASVGDDKKLIIWDTRTNTPAYVTENAHDGDINVVSFSPFSQFLIATGSQDKTVAVWDMRKIDSKIVTLEGHTDDVLQVKWSPNEETILGSSSSDNKVCIWNIEKVSENETKDSEDGQPSGLAFIHGGHSDAVGDFSWFPEESRLIASVSSDNIMQIWKMDNDLSKGLDDDKLEKSELDVEESEEDD